MNIFHLPNHAKTLEKELTAILIDDSNLDLSKEQLFGIALASAYATNDNAMVKDLVNYAREHINVSTITLSKYAASLAELNSGCKKQELLKTGFRSTSPVQANTEAEKSKLGSDIYPTTPERKIKQHSCELTLPEDASSPLLESKQALDYDTDLFLLAAMYINDREACIKISAECICGLVINKRILMTIVRISALIEGISAQLDYVNKKVHKVLLIDDDARITRRVKLSLERNTSFTVRTENCSLNAMNAVRDFSPDLILLDLYMPGKNGDDILKSLNADPKLSDIKVMFLTSLLTKEEAGERGKMINGNLFMAKPTEDNILIETIQEQLTSPELLAV